MHGSSRRIRAESNAIEIGRPRPEGGWITRPCESSFKLTLDLEIQRECGVLQMLIWRSFEAWENAAGSIVATTQRHCFRRTPQTPFFFSTPQATVFVAILWLDWVRAPMTPTSPT